MGDVSCDESDLDDGVEDVVEMETVEQEADASDDDAERQRAASDLDSFGRDLEQEWANADTEEAQQRRAHVAQCGIVQRIKLTNFLCHEHLCIDLCPHINFITGKNGSGKSAILIGLCACFGMKASSTNRGSSIKDLIRKGEEWGKVEVTLANCGRDAFEHDRYGDAIVVSREFRKNGSSQYRILSAKGAVLGRSRSELDRITDHFGIQVENPCVVMNQDTSRELLRGSNVATQMYSFFLKATQLQKIGEELEEAEERLQSTAMDLVERKEQVNGLQQQLQAARDRLDQAKNLHTIDADIKTCESEIVWAEIEEREAELGQLKESVNALAKRKTKLDELQYQAWSEKVEIDKRQQEEAEKMAEVEKMIDAEKERRSQLKKYATEARITERHVESQIAELRKRINDAQERCNLHRSQLDEALATSNSDRSDAQRQCQVNLENLQLKLREAKELRQSISIEAAQANDESDQTVAMTKTATSELNRAKGEVKHLEISLKQTQHNINEDLARFGTETALVLDAIEQRQSEFRKRPLGPLGRYINISDPSVAVPIENAIGSSILGAYLVDNWADEKVLSDIFKRVFSQTKSTSRRPLVLMSQFCDRRHQVKSLERFSREFNATVLLDSLDISDVSVFNAVVDNSRLDVSVCLDDSTMGHRLVREFPQISVFTRRGYRISSGRSKLIFDEYVHCVGMLGKRTQDDLSRIQSQLEHARRKVEVMQRDLNELKHRAQEGANLSRMKRHDLSKAIENIKRIESEINDTQLRLEAASQFDEDATDGLRDVISQIRSYIETTELEIDEKLEELKNLKAHTAKATENHQQFLGQTDQYRTKIQNLHSTITKMVEQSAKLGAKMEKISADRTKLMDTLEDYENQVETESESLRCAIEEANKVCERIDSTQSLAKLQKKLASLNKRKDEEQERIEGTLEEIEHSFIAAEACFHKARMHYRKVKRDHKKLDSLRIARSKRWEKLLHHLGVATTNNFAFHLSKRGHDGAIQFKHHKARLDLHVKAAGSGTGRETKDCKSLSGGERSFATLAFIIAVGESIRAPFRCMDEPDIFMDSVTRRNAIQTLMDLASHYKNRQFIFVTPLDTSMVARCETTQVWKLADPVRH